MLRNYLTVAFRNLLRHKAFSAINILGLAIGIAACLLILQYVRFELSYDNFHSKADRIYRVQQDRYDKGKLSTQWAAGAYAVGNSFKDAFGEVEDYAKLVKRRPMIAGYGAEKFKVEKLFFATQSFFHVFDYPLVAGDVRTALKEPFTVTLSQSTAKKLFKNGEALGKTIRLDDRFDCKITGIFKDFPDNTHLKSDMFISYATFVKQMGPDNNPETSWMWDGCMTYLLLKPGTHPRALEAKFPAYLQKTIGEELKKYDANVVYLLQPVQDIHLYSHYMEEAEPNGDGNAVYLLLGIAFFIIVIAWVNYINLATARAINRAKEVGIRKVVGSFREQLVRQFLFESALLNALAVVLALILVIIALPLFSNLSGQKLSFSLLGSGSFWGALLVLFVVGALLSGLYPAFVLSSFKPVVVLKGKLSTSRQGVLLRKSLVVFQFAASLFLLIGTLTVFRQIGFMREQSLGIQIDQTLVVQAPIIRTDSTFESEVNAFKEEMTRFPGIRRIAVSTAIPSEPSGWNAGGHPAEGHRRTGRQAVPGDWRGL